MQGSRFDLRVDLADPFALADTFGLLGERFNRDAIEEMRALHERLMAADWDDAPPAHGPGMHAHGGAPAQRPGRHAAQAGPPSWAQAAEQLRQMGAVVYLPEEEGGRLGWDDMAGYEEQKRALEDLVLMSVKHAEEFERVAKLTRKDGKHHRTKVRLFELAPSRVDAQRHGTPGRRTLGPRLCACEECTTTRAAVVAVYLWMLAGPRSVGCAGRGLHLCPDSACHQHRSAFSRCISPGVMAREEYR